MDSVKTRPVTIPFKSSKRDAAVWIVSDLGGWQPIEMKHGDEKYEYTFQIPEDQHTLLYKFRIGDWEWMNDPEVPSVPDGFGGINNRYEIPATPKPVESQQPDVEPVEDTASIIPVLGDSMPSATQSDKSVVDNLGVERKSIDDNVKNPLSLVPETQPFARPDRGRTDLEDEAYHSSDSATPKASRSTSISEIIDTPADVPYNEKTASSRGDKTPETESRNTDLESESTSNKKPAGSTHEVVAGEQSKLDITPIYLGLAAITVALVAYFLR